MLELVALGALVALAVVLAAVETGPNRSRELALVAALAAAAAGGRVVFAAIPNVQPVTMIVAVAGTTLGPRAGLATGAAAALASNAFLGQGPWTPWQMLGWGLVGARRRVDAAGASESLRSGGIRHRVRFRLRLADGPLGVECARPRGGRVVVRRTRLGRDLVRRRPRRRERRHRPGSRPRPHPHARPLRPQAARQLRTTGGNMIRPILLVTTAALAAGSGGVRRHRRELSPEPPAPVRRDRGGRHAQSERLAHRVGGDGPSRGGPLAGIGPPPGRANHDDLPGPPRRQLATRVCDRARHPGGRRGRPQSAQLRRSQPRDRAPAEDRRRRRHRRHRELDLLGRDRPARRRGSGSEPLARRHPRAPSAPTAATPGRRPPPPTPTTPRRP